MEFALKLTKKILLKMLVGFKKIAIALKFTLKSPSILKKITKLPHFLAMRVG